MLLESLSGIRIYWSEWFLAFLPVSALTIVACWGVTLWLYPPERAQTEIVAPEGGPSAHPADRWTIEEKKSALILTALIGLWSTDALHHVSPEMVAIGVGLAAFLPGIKALTGEDLRRFNMTPVIFTGAALSLAGIQTETGAIAPLATAMFAWMTPLVTRVPAAVTALYWSGIGYHLVMPNAQALLSTSMPALLQFGASHHLDPRALGMIWTFASGPSVMLYQSGIIILGYSYGYFDARDFLRYGLVLTAIEGVLLVACASLYWPAIGLPLLR